MTPFRAPFFMVQLTDLFFAIFWWLHVAEELYHSDGGPLSIALKAVLSAYMILPANR